MAGVVGAQEAAGAGARVALAAAEVPAVVAELAELAVPAAVELVGTGARGVRAAERVVGARVAERVAERRTPTSTIRRILSRGPLFRLFQTR